MKSKTVVAISIALLFTVQNLCVAAAQENQKQQAAPKLGLNNVEMTVKLMSPISTKTSKRGDTFTAQVISPGPYENAVIEGRINAIKKAKKRDKAAVSFVFETMTLSGVTYPIQADLKDVTNSQGVKDVDEEGRAIGKTSKKKALASALIGSAIGAALGAAVAGGRGAAAGAGVGAAAGLLIGITFTTAGSDMEFAPGSQFTLSVSDRARQ